MAQEVTSAQDQADSLKDDISNLKVQLEEKGKQLKEASDSASALQVCRVMQSLLYAVLSWHNASLRHVHAPMLM